MVIILTDDQGWGDLSLHGNTNLFTPNIDRIGTNGARFDRFYVSPVCSPTRAELLTGRAHPRCGVYSTSEGGERIDLDETTLAEIFRSAGYRTAAYGKWHSGMQPPYHPNARGFEDFYGFCSGHWGDYYSPMLEHNGKIITGDGYLTDDFTNRAMAFMEQNRDHPFLLYIPLNTPHSPMQVPDRWWLQQKERPLALRHREPQREDTLLTKAALAMCENIDWNVGRIMEKIESLDLADQTIIIFFTDNGPWGWRWNGGMKGAKGHTDEGGVRVPLLMQWKGVIEPGTAIDHISSVTDLLPTLIELTGIEFTPVKELDGRSLSSLLMGEAPQWEERMIVSHWAGKVSVRSQRFRLDHMDRLFDMQSDPGQWEDVSSLYPEERKRLLAEKERWEREVLSELNQDEMRAFPIGHPEFSFTQIPARDGIPHGNITRSNRYPNCSYFTNWKSVDDYISWDIEVLQDGEYDVELYYTCSEVNTGPLLELSFGEHILTKRITEAHDPPPVGPEHDCFPRMVSPVKHFRPLDMGSIHLEKGRGDLILKATKIPGNEAIDFRLLMFQRKE